MSKGHTTPSQKIVTPGFFGRRAYKKLYNKKILVGSHLLFLIPADPKGTAGLAPQSIRGLGSPSQPPQQC
jgi:hypothetical protein